MGETSPVLISWCARSNDPYERDRDGKFQLDKQGQPVPSPTLTVLFDPESCYANNINDVVLLYNDKPGGASKLGAEGVEQTVKAIKGKKPSIRCERHEWVTIDPTDHSGILDFLKDKLDRIRAKYAGRELIIHISPGTPAMQTVWVLMAECGFIQQPFTVVKSYRKGERKNRNAVVPFSIGIETFYKVFQSSRPTRTSTAEEQVQWDPARFKSAKLIALYQEARSFARLRVPVLITGERGTGKTTLANWIRANSGFCKPESNNNWASVPCGQYTTETMRAELFGYVKGAFTGAEKDRDGLLKTADGDTLFLDEVGDISRDLQRVLIRAVEEGTYYRLGSTKAEKSTFRLISATNIADSELKKRLDPDFYDRIGGLRLAIPALREVPEDLPWLWRSSFQTAVHRCGVSTPIELTLPQHEQVVNRLLAHRLSGNIRDLLRVANRIIARLADASDADWSVVLDYAMASLEEQYAPSKVATQIAKAFVEGERLDALLESRGRIDVGPFETDIRAFLASELRRIARERKVEPSDLCDVSSRTLRDWAARNSTSDARRKSSDQ